MKLISLLRRLLMNPEKYARQKRKILLSLPDSAFIQK